MAPAIDGTAAIGPAPAPAFPRRLLVALVLGIILNPVNSSMLAPGLEPIGRSLNASTSELAWLIGGLYIASAVSQPLAGKAADRVGPRRVFLVGGAVCVTAGVFGALAPSVWWLVASRVVLGFGSTAMMPAALVLVRLRADEAHLDTPRSVLSLLATATQIAAVVGPPLGGVLVDLFGWRSVFVINVPLGLVALAGAAYWLPPDPPRSTARFWRETDRSGLLLFALATTSTSVFVLGARLAQWPWLVVGVGLFVLLGRREKRSTAPFLDLALLKRRPALARTCLRTTLIALATYCVLYGFTPWLQSAAGRTASQAALILLPLTVFGAVSSVAARWGSVRTQLVVSASAMLVGSALMVAMTGSAAVGLLVLIPLAFAIPNGTGSVANQIALYGQSPPSHMGASAGLARTGQYLGAIVASGFIATAFGRHIDDGGLHRLGLILVVLAVGVLALIVLDPALRPRLATSQRVGKINRDGYLSFRGGAGTVEMSRLSDALDRVPAAARAHFGLDKVAGEAETRPLPELLDLTGRAILVTGGGGDDLGSALCRRLADQGATVGVLDVDGSAAQRVAADLLERTGRAAYALTADVSQWDQINAAVASFVTQAGRIDVLINNAGGGFGTHGPFATRTKAEIDVVLDTNLTGVLYATHAALAHMIAQRSGRIITIASEGGRVAMRDLAVYNTCKAAVIALMRNLSRELGEANISTVTVCPGALLAPKLVDRMAAWPGELASAIDQGFASTSLGRFGLPDEVAVAVAFLASDAGSYVNGTELSVSGGQSA